MESNITLTGFKAFGDVTENPTQIITEHFRQRQDPRFAGLAVIDVSITAVNDYCNSHATPDQYQKRHLVIHLGVNQGATTFQIENFAYNNTTFRIPDNEGNQPQAQLIASEMALDAPIQTTFPTNEVIANLKNDHLLVNYSDNPGRYLCNYIYFRSLSTVAAMMPEKEVDVVFIHAPPQDQCPIEDQIRFVEKVIELWKMKFEVKSPGTQDISIANHDE